jgi:hypothetical protein
MRLAPPVLGNAAQYLHSIQAHSRFAAAGRRPGPAGFARGFRNLSYQTTDGMPVAVPCLALDLTREGAQARGRCPRGRCSQSVVLTPT